MPTRLTFEPNVFDIPENLPYKSKLQVLHDRLKMHAEDWDWGFYTNTVHQIYKLHYAEENHSAALNSLLEVLYLDLNGPINSHHLQGSEYGLIDEFAHCFDSRSGTIAPAWIKWGQSLIKRLSLGKGEVRTMFLERAKHYYNNVRLPASRNPLYTNGRMPTPPDMAWDMVEYELFP